MAKVLTDLPNELVGIIIFWTLGIDPSAEPSVLLTSRAFHSNAGKVARRSAVEHITAEYGRLAVMLFGPAPKTNALRCWLPRVAKVAKGIESLLDATVTYISVPRDPEYTITSAGQRVLVTGKDLRSAMKMGLYLTASINFKRQRAAGNVRRLLQSIPYHAILLIRLASMLVALTIRRVVCTNFERFTHLDGARYPALWVRDPYTLIWAVENELLSGRTQNFVDMVAPGVPLYDVSKYRMGGAKWKCYTHTPESRLESFMATAENDRIDALGRAGLLELKRSMELAQLYSSYPPGRLREKQKALIVARRVKEKYGDDLKLWSLRLEDVRRLQAELSTGLLGPESEVMEGFKAEIDFLEVERRTRE